MTGKTACVLLTLGDFSSTNNKAIEKGKELAKRRWKGWIKTSHLTEEDT